jgi:hypothetical protein
MNKVTETNSYKEIFDNLISNFEKKYKHEDFYPHKTELERRLFADSRLNGDAFYDSETKSEKRFHAARVAAELELIAHDIELGNIAPSDSIDKKELPHLKKLSLNTLRNLKKELFYNFEVDPRKYGISVIIQIGRTTNNERLSKKITKIEEAHDSFSKFDNESYLDPLDKANTILTELQSLKVFSPIHPKTKALINEMANHVMLDVSCIVVEKIQQSHPNLKNIKLKSNIEFLSDYCKLIREGSKLNLFESDIKDNKTKILQNVKESFVEDAADKDYKSRTFFSSARFVIKHMENEDRKSLNSDQEKNSLIRSLDFLCYNKNKNNNLSR